VDDFTVDEQAGTVTCPAGHTRPISTTRVATFGALCRTCPLRPRCTTCTTGRKLVLRPRDDLLRQARRDWATNPELRARSRRHRPNVERAISQLASRGGRRLKLRYLGTAANHAWLKRRTAALNLRSLISHGLTCRNGTWTLATTRTQGATPPPCP
jgi:DDE family transposase